MNDDAFICKPPLSFVCLFLLSLPPSPTEKYVPLVPCVGHVFAFVLFFYFYLLCHRHQNLPANFSLERHTQAARTFFFWLPTINFNEDIKLNRCFFFSLHSCTQNRTVSFNYITFFSPSLSLSIWFTVPPILDSRPNLPPPARYLFAFYSFLVSLLS